MRKYSVLITILLMLIACDLPSDKVKFYISTPPGWDRTDSVENYADTEVTLKSPLENANDIFRENIILLVSKGVNESEFIHNTLRDIKEDANIFEETGSGHRSITGVRSYWCEVKVKYKTSELTCTQRYYFLFANQHIYTFIVTSLQNDFEKMRPYIDEVLDTFKIL
jgi:hypothetical protein